MQIPNTKTTNQKQKIEFRYRVYSYTLKSLKFLGHLAVDKVSRIIVDQLFYAGSIVAKPYGAKMQTNANFKNT